MSSSSTLVGGAQFVCSIAVFFGGGMTFYAWCRRQCLAWTPELCDPSTQIYPSVPELPVPWIRRVMPQTEEHPVLGKEVPGVLQVQGALSSREASMLLAETERLMRRLGRRFHEERKSMWVQDLTEAGVGTDFVNELQYLSDHPEDARPASAPWGCGDALRTDQVPAVLRELTNHIQRQFPYIGELRHVLIEYSPTGEWYRRPKLPPKFDGHDYVVIPLLRRPEMVFTLSPVLRSRASHGSEIASSSWTSRDLDLLISSGSFTRVYGTARHYWGLGIRPAQWFGSPSFPLLHNLPPQQSLAEQPHWWKRLFYRPHRPVSLLAPRDEAVIYLHFEGPTASNGVRNKFTRPQSMAFGEIPTQSTYDTWEGDAPMEHSIEAEGVMLWLVKNLPMMAKLGGW